MLLSTGTWYLVTVLLVHVFATQAPFQPSSAESTVGNEDLGDWNLDAPPNSNSTDHLVFETVHSLLQRWPNTRMRNGHAIVPGIIPKGTLLYHGTNHSELPTGPEWFATDPEHAYIFCGHDPKHECWQFTIVTTRPLKVVYFDGSSAAKLPYGPLDTQDLLLWGEPRGGATAEDMVRIQDICEWGKDYGVDGFAADGFVSVQLFSAHGSKFSQETPSELMLCDMTSGVSAVSSLNLVNRLLGFPEQSILLEISAFELMNAGSWHNPFPGETRVQLDLAGLVTFYDTQLAPSLVPIRAGQERWDHRVQNVSGEDLSAVRARLGEVLTRPEGLSSGICWKTLIQVIVDRYAQRLELVRHLLNTTYLDDILDSANKTQTQLRIMLTPYILLSAAPPVDSSLGERVLDWATPIFRLCATTHTRSLDSELPSMTSSEKLLLRAIRGTTREICRVITKMWAAGVHAGLDLALPTREDSRPDVARVARLRSEWIKDLDHLMTWLDWSIWVKCDPVCGPMELCYLPTWPIGFPGGDKIERGETNVTLEDDSTSDEWRRPQPKCIRRIAPYGF